MKKVLFITAAGGDIACAALRCIRRGYPQAHIVGCDIQPYVQGVDYLDEFVIAPPYRDREAYLEFIKSICMEKEVTHFFPMGEPEILIADENRDFFRENGIRLLIQRHNVLEVASSKYETARYLRENGILAPETYYKAQYRGQLGYPVIVKADKGCGSRGLKAVCTKGEWDGLSGLDGQEYVVQEYIGDADHEYTTGVFSDGRTVKSITYRRMLGFGGMSVRVETVADRAVEDTARRVAELFKLRGCINIQMRLTAQGYSIFEINPRISSTAGFRDLMGFHDVVWWLQDADGEEIVYGKPIKPGVVGIKTLDEKIFPQTIFARGADE